MASKAITYLTKKDRVKGRNIIKRGKISYLEFKSSALFCHLNRHINESNIFERRSRSLVTITMCRN